MQADGTNTVLVRRLSRLLLNTDKNYTLTIVSQDNITFKVRSAPKGRS